MNAVFRWELRRGSNLYAVWMRQQQDVADPGDFRFGRDAAALFSARGDDVFPGEDGVLARSVTRSN